jgi:hypothetical protein
MSKKKAHYISVSVTDIINESGLKRFLSDNFNYIKPNVANHSPFEKLSTISVSLTGDIIENFMRIKFSLADEDLQDEILDDIQTAKEKYQKLHEKVIAVYYQELEEYNTPLDKWIIYSDDDYDLVIDSLETNFLGHYFFDKSIIKKVRPHGDTTIIEEKGYSLISASNYYGNIVCKLEQFEQLYGQLLNSLNCTVLEEIEALKCLVLFTHVSIRPQWLQLSKNKKNIGFYSDGDLSNINNLLKSIPNIDYSTGAMYHPPLYIEFEKGTFEGRLFATPDFICNNKIVEVKASSSISKMDFYQIIIYYALAKHAENIECYGDEVMGCEIVYAKRNLKITYDFYNTISTDKLVSLQREIIDSVIRYYKNSSQYKIPAKYKKRKP